MYLYYLASVKSNLPDLKNIKNLLVPLALASLPGVLYFLALITSTTTVLALIVIAIFTVIQSVIDHHSGRISLPAPHFKSRDVIGISTAPFVVRVQTIRSLGYQLYSWACLPESCAYCRNRCARGSFPPLRGKTWHYLLSFGGLATGGFILMEIYPPFASIGLQAYTLLFGSSTFVSGVLNTEPLSLHWRGPFQRRPNPCQPVVFWY